MGLIGGAISNLLSLGAKLLPVVKESAIQAPSSSSSSLPPVDQNQRSEAELEKLMRILERIKATLQDAEQREIRDMSVKLWLKELKEVAYDAEDVLDEYHYEVLRAQVEARDASPPDSRKRKLVQVPDAMFDQIQQIGNKFDEIEKCRIALRLSEEEGRRCFDIERQRARTSHLVDVSNIFGREKEKEELIGLLSPECHDDKVVSMVAIVGTGGLGKTTLAQLVYNDIKRRSRFDIFGWICVSEDFDVNRLTKELVESINPKDKCGLTNLSALQTKISEQIRGKRVLLVLDDVWNENRNLWDSFQAPLLSSALVRILVTTRNRQVVQIMQIEKTLNLSCLSAEESWRLFKHYAFDGVNPNEGSELVKIGKQIVKKCGMSPLAIKSIGSLLWHEEQEERWREILENELSECDASDQIFNPLQISYTHLPTKLKPCLIYCSMFPKDYVYEVESLVEEWFCHGYIECKGKEDAKRIGQKYAKQLWQRSFFETVWGGVEFGSYLKLHDIIHDLARLHSDNGCCSIVAGKLPVSPNKVCHLYVARSVEPTEPIPFGSFTTLRTLIMGRDVQNCFSNFDLSMAQNLRVLKIEDQNYELEFLHAVGNLKHLRFLSLDCSHFQELPKSICSLYKLQELTLQNCFIEEGATSIGNLVSLETLTLKEVMSLRVLPESFCQLKALRELALLECPELKELPSDIGNLVSLERLYIEYSCIERLPESFCQLKALRELVLFYCHALEELPSDIGSLASLQALDIRFTGVSSLPSSFNKIIGIQKLRVELVCQKIGWLEDFADLGGTLWLDGLRNLCSLNDVQCANLGRMHNLEHLILSWDDQFDDLDEEFFVLLIKRGHSIYPESKNDISVMASLQPHPNLRELDIYCYGDVVFPEWVGNPSSCASLERIHIDGCKNLTFLPFGSLHKLKYLHIMDCDSLQIIGAESLPLELQELKIGYCTELISVPGIQKLKSLDELHINGCEKLHLLVINAQPSVELTARTNASAYRNSMLGLRNLTSLRSLKIRWCPQLQLLADELPCVESCEVEVEGCRLLREWCLQHGINYKE